MASQAAQFEALLEHYAPGVAAAFRASIADIAKHANVRKMVAALKAGDVTAAIEAMHIDESAFTEFEEAFREVFIRAGNDTADAIPPFDDEAGNPVRIRFSGRHPLAERFLSDHSGQLITDVTVDTRQAVRETMTKALALGKNPTTIVAETVGRVNRVSGRREGGVLGLTTQQARAVGRASDELSSGDPAALSDYLARKLRDKRYDKSISAALKAGNPVPDTVKTRALSSYRNRLLAHRAKIIGRTEVMTALNKGRDQAYEQAVADGKLKAENITKKWRDAHDARVRHSHAILGSRPPILFNEFFVSPATGAMMRFPMDSSMGAQAEDIIGCRCTCEYRVDFFAGVK